MRKGMKINYSIGNFQLCWDCAKACGGYGGCEWSINLKPVPGWTAEPRTIHSERQEIPTYHVIKCPQFVRDSYCGGTRRTPKKED